MLLQQQCMASMMDLDTYLDEAPWLPDDILPLRGVHLAHQLEQLYRQSGVLHLNPALHNPPSPYGMRVTTLTSLSAFKANRT